MSLNNPYTGEGFVPAYQISAVPFVTSSAVSLGQVKQINFNFVTRFFEIKNMSPSANVLTFGFTSTGLGSAPSNFFKLSGSQSYSGEIRTDRLFISGAVGASTEFQILAGLTSVPARNFLVITSSNGYTGVG
jgi:hypothetical protein